MNRNAQVTILALAIATPAAAQGVMLERTPATQTALLKRAIEEQGGERAKVAVESRVTPGAPYSAEAITESLQVLSDGNRISRKTTTRIYRDSEGRTRREQLSPAGHPQSVSISDPVAGTTFILSPSDRTASRTNVMLRMPSIATATTAAGSVYTVRTREAGSSAGGSEPSADAKRKREAETLAVSGASPGVHAGTAVYPAVGAVAVAGEAGVFTFAPGGVTNKEDLGQQTIEGVIATGTRTTTTIPPGSIGNEQPIVIVSEQWFSPDLQVLIMTKHSDPRTGETSYRLTNVVQTEPARSLFEVPGDYTIEESGIRRQPPVQPDDYD
jgi:hypothetical protein